MAANPDPDAVPAEYIQWESGAFSLYHVTEEIADRYGFSSLTANYERAAPYNDSGGETSYGDNSWKVLGGGIESDAVDLAWFGYKVLDGQIVDATTRDNRLRTPVVRGQPNGSPSALSTSIASVVLP